VSARAEVERTVEALAAKVQGAVMDGRASEVEHWASALRDAAAALDDAASAEQRDRE
jgi:hypothetical protein